MVGSGLFQLSWWGVFKLVTQTWGGGDIYDKDRNYQCVQPFQCQWFCWREREIVSRSAPGHSLDIGRVWLRQRRVSQHHGQGQDRNSTTPQVTLQMGHRARKRLKYQTWTTRTYQDEYYYIRMSIGCIYILLENGHSFYSSVTTIWM